MECGCLERGVGCRICGGGHLKRSSSIWVGGTETEVGVVLSVD